MKTTSYLAIALAITFFITALHSCSSDSTENPKDDDIVLTSELKQSSDKIVSPQEKTTKHIDIITNLEIKDVKTSSSAEWVTSLLDKEKKRLDVTIQANDETKSRKSYVILSGGGVSDTLNVEQIGMAQEILFTKDKFNVDHTTQPIKVELQTNIENLTITPQDNWVVSVASKSLDLYTYNFEITENTTKVGRSTTISFSNEDKSVNKTIQISQLAPPPIVDLTMAYNLNLIYFIPNDITPPDDYKRRLSELMLWARDFYAKNMERNGYGYRGFGLRTIDNETVEIIVINGKLGHAAYPYEGGNGAVQSELNEYFTANPTASGGDHNLIIIPSYTGDPMSPGGPPFYGVGRTCYALDYEDMDIKYLGDNSAKGTLLTKWFGGLAHELGHGLNLPHNKQLVSQNQNLGTTLMGAGNYSLGINPTFVSEASCALLNNCQVFSPVKRDFYQPNSSVEIESFHIEHMETTINVKGEIKNSSKPINAINIYVDDYPYTGVNENYDAESWTILDLTNNEFSIEIPINEVEQSDDRFRIRTWFLFDDGTYIEESHDFNRTDLNDYHFVIEKDMPRDGWEISASDSDNTSPATLMLDNDINSFWHSQWLGAKPGHPHTITVKMAEANEVRGFSFVQRQSLHGAINQFELEVSSDGITWEPQGEYNLVYAGRKQFIYLPESKVVSMFRIKTISNYTGHDPEIATLAEIGAFK